MPDLIGLLAVSHRSLLTAEHVRHLQLAATAACCVVNRNSEGEQRPSHSMCETPTPHTSSFTFAEIAVDPAVVQMLHFCSRTIGSNYCTSLS